MRTYFPNTGEATMPWCISLLGVDTEIEVANSFVI